MKTVTMDGNTAACYVSYAFTEVAVIYPITPSTPMSELADEWSVSGKKNIFGTIPKVTQMQSESGVAGAVHGSLSCGALTTTYTCSQGLLLTLPNMYKIAGELLPTVFHVSARSLATHALSIFGDHQDVMACRQAGFAMLAAGSVQETADMALIAHLATLKTSVPFLHFFDGFRTSHETCKIEVLEYDEMKKLVDQQDIENFRNRALSPDHPMQKGTAQNGDTYFQNREAANSFYLSLPETVQSIMDKTAVLTGRKYRLFDYFGAEDAENIAIVLGSGGCVLEETVTAINKDKNIKCGRTGLIKVRLYRPFDVKAFCAVLPKTCKKIAVLDRTKESGSIGEPLYLDVCAALKESGLAHIQVVGGRYGLGSKEFTPSMCLAVFENLASEMPKNHFTVGIVDDVTHTSIQPSAPLILPHKDRVECVFYGLGSDGTVGANKNSVKLIGAHTDLYVQAYFCYDSKKSGGVTVSHLRFGKTPILSPYLVQSADFVACHNPSYLTKYDMLSKIKDGGIFLLNCPWQDQTAFNAHLPATLKQTIAKKRLSFYVIDATKIANEVGLNGRTSTVMQAAFFFLNPTLLPYEQAISLLKMQLKEKFAKKGEKVVEMNVLAVEKAAAAVQKIEYPPEWEYTQEGAPLLPLPENEYFREFIHPILSLRGDELPVSSFQPDGRAPTGTTRFERRGVAYLLPQWIPENCIQCNQCSFVCPHACIRPFVADKNAFTADMPPSFITKPAVGVPNAQFRIQVSAHDCLGCGVCANTCPAKEKALVMCPAIDLMPEQGKNWEYAQTLPQADTNAFKPTTVKGSQFRQPLFEFSYACSGCGETPYIKVLTQLFGEKMIIANATGCSSIYGGSSPTCPYTVNKNGCGPAWANSLFEDNAEFGYGMRLAIEAGQVRDEHKKFPSVWIIGGDGWAYDIGFGGLDHVLASDTNVNVLVLDSEVYSNTGGQTSKATPLGAVARFSAGGKRHKKKDLGLMAMTYGHVYVAQVSMGANKQQFLNALTEAEAYNGPSLILAYSPCIAHGVNMSKSMDEERDAVECGYWPLYRFHPDKKKNGENPFTLDSKPPTRDFKEFLLGENRFAVLKKNNPELADKLFTQAETYCQEKFAFLQRLANGL
ncbi:MAG: pyruvate:ferredoxin (flavodoxin) oxidoreductase [Clostridiales bacterium]|nr:pyruvate:ferredoxin (flavodoxin) oxidoreductase [Clostridiales bacterium]